MDAYADGDQDRYLLIMQNPVNQEIKKLFENIPKNAINHFSTLRRWIKNEQLDLEAIIEAIERKNGLE